VPQPRDATRAKQPRGRAFRGLVLVFLFSLLNVVDLILTTTVLGEPALPPLQDLRPCRDMSSRCSRSF
jgi:hypothetical protein